MAYQASFPKVKCASSPKISCWKDFSRKLSEIKQNIKISLLQSYKSRKGNKGSRAPNHVPRLKIY